MSGDGRWHLPQLITERLHPRPITPADVPLLHAHWNQPWVRLHLFDGQDGHRGHANEAARAVWQAIDRLKTASP